MTMQEQLKINKQSWDESAERFFGRTALPEYGPHAPTEEKLQLFDPLAGKKVLEVGCGSGHSLLYMLNHGVDEAVGLDLSKVQIETARRVVGDSVKVKLYESPMEENPGLVENDFDIAYSIFALGWTLDLHQTLSNVYSYIKPGGSFIFSWEHPLHGLMDYKEGVIYFSESYWEETRNLHKAWAPRPAVYQHRKLSTYLNELIRVGFTIEQVIEDVEIQERERGGNPSSWYSEFKAGYLPATMIVKCRK
ncbi:class I SAM-dependent methyltransferase [Paenibacillus sp. 481]|nr:class I SAM-dependent methyltransferase [Paenibacillus sp. 481]